MATAVSKSKTKPTVKKPAISVAGETVAIAKQVKTPKPKVNQALIAQVIRVLELRQRQATSKTKKRGEISGGGKKPWKQKGTGRARAGSIRSPLWRGGGIVFGPAPDRHYKLNINKQMKVAALAQAWALKSYEGAVVEVAKWPEMAKTKAAVKFLTDLKKEGNFLLIAEKHSEGLKRASRNLPYAQTVDIQNVNAKDILVADVIVIDKASLAKLQEKLK